MPSSLDVDAGVRANELIKQIATAVDGRGGGKADLGYKEVLATPVTLLFGKEGTTCAVGASGVASVQVSTQCSDFDGVGDSLPEGLKDVSQYPNLIKVLLERGHSDAEIEKICSGNVLRVWDAVESFAAR